MDPVVVLHQPCWEVGLKQYGVQPTKTPPHGLSVHQNSGLAMVAAGSSTIIFSACDQEKQAEQACVQCSPSQEPVCCVSVRRGQGGGEASLGVALTGNTVFLIDLLGGKVVNKEIWAHESELVCMDWHPKEMNVLGLSTKSSLHICVADDPHLGTSQGNYGPMVKCEIQATRDIVPKLDSWAWLHDGDGAVIAWNALIEIVTFPGLEGLAPNIMRLGNNLMRRRVLLGVPGAIRTVCAGPASSILCTIDAPLRFHMDQLNETNSFKTLPQDSFQAIPAQESDVIDLSGSWLQGRRKKQSTIETLLQMEPAVQQGLPGRLCVFWQFSNHVHHQPPAAASSQSTLLCLPFPVPDLLHVAHNLVLVSSSHMAADISVFQVNENGGDFIMTLQVDVDVRTDSRLLDFGVHLDLQKKTVSIITKIASIDQPKPTIFSASSQRFRDVADTKLHCWDATDALRSLQDVLFPEAQLLPTRSSVDPVVQISEMLQTFQQRISVQMDQILTTMESFDKRLNDLEKRSSGA